MQYESVYQYVRLAMRIFKFIAQTIEPINFISPMSYWLCACDVQKFGSLCVILAPGAGDTKIFNSWFTF